MTAINPLSVHRVPRMKVDPAKQSLPVACVGSLAPPGYERRRPNPWKPVNPIDPNDKDYDRSNVKLRKDDREVLKPNISDDKSEDEDVHSSGAEYYTSDEDDEEDDSDDTRKRSGHSTTRKTGDLGEESYNDADDDDSSSVESDSSDGGSSDSESLTSSSDEEDSDKKKTGPRRRRLPGQRNCASDDGADDIWAITDEVLKISDAGLNTSKDVLKISDSDSSKDTSDEKAEDPKLKSEREDLLIFGRIREPNSATVSRKGAQANTAAKKGAQPKDNFPRGTKKFNPCHINHSLHQQNPVGRGAFRNNDPTYTRRPNRNAKANANRSTVQKKETWSSVTSGKHLPTKAAVRPHQITSPSPQGKVHSDHMSANQNNNKTSTYADVCRRSSPSPKPPVISQGCAPIAPKQQIPPAEEMPAKHNPKSSQSRPRAKIGPRLCKIGMPPTPASKKPATVSTDVRSQKTEKRSSRSVKLSNEEASAYLPTPTSIIVSDDKPAVSTKDTLIDTADDASLNPTEGGPIVVPKDISIPVPDETPTVAANTESGLVPETASAEFTGANFGEPFPRTLGPESSGANVTGTIDEDPAILCVSTNPPCGVPHGLAPSLHQQMTSPYAAPPPIGLPPPGYMPYDNNYAYAYTNYVYSLLNQLNPQDLLRIMYELKMLEAMNINFNPTFMPTNGNH